MQRISHFAKVQIISAKMLLLSVIFICLGIQSALAAPPDDFVTTWKTDNSGTSNSTSITVPMIGGLYNVDWNNDGVFDEFGLSGSVTHDFVVSGTYTIRITGHYDSIRLVYGGDARKLLSIVQWGTNTWTTMEDAFRGASYLTIPATDTPDFSAVTNMSSMFEDANLVRPDTSGWNTSSVTDMSRMFQGALNAQPDTSNWDTSAVTTMFQMFANARWITMDTSGWNTSAVTNMSGMFMNANWAEPDTSGWDTSAVTDMSQMFLQANFAQPETGGWDTAAVTDMRRMFIGAKSANPNTGKWDTSAVTNMSNMFAEATSANPDTSGWDTSAVTEMYGMFSGATSANPDTRGWNTAMVTGMNGMFSGATSANPDTSGWDTSAVTDMSHMFYKATSANPDTSGWNTSSVTRMFAMFWDATLANPDISDWNTAAVTDMTLMFSGAVSFDQNIGSWDVASLVNARDMFSGVALSTANYDSLLIGWDAQILQSGVNFSGGNSNYCSAAAIAARANIVSSDSWVITDGGEASACPPPKPILAPDLTPESDTGVSNSDDFTLDNTPDFFVQCSNAGNSNTLYTDNPTINTAVGFHECAGAGTEVATVTTSLVGGMHQVTYTDQDVNGESGHSPALTVNIDMIFNNNFEREN